MPATVYNDFSGGHAGTLDLAKVPPNFFHAKNMLVTRSGALCPRPGFRTQNLGRTIAGPVRGLGHVGASSGRSLIYFDNDVIYYSDPDNAANRAGIGPIVFPNNEYPVYITDVTANVGFMSVSATTNAASKLYRLRPDANAIDLVNNAWGSTSFAIYGIRAVKNENQNIRRLWYSAADDATSNTAWPSGNFIDVSISDRIVFLAAQRNSLVIATADGQWWTLTGVPGSSQSSLRRISGGKMAPAQVSPWAFVDLGDDNIYLLDPTNNYPGFFNGAKYDDLPYLSMSTNPLASYAAGTLTNAVNGAAAIQAADNHSPAFILPSENRMLLSHNGVWTMHDIGVGVSNLWASNGRGRIWGFNAAKNAILTTQLRLDRPAFTSDLAAQPGDQSDTPVDAEVTVPEFWAEDGQPIRVSEVLIDFVRWNTGAPVDNRIQISVSALGRNDAPDATTMVTWEQAGSNSAATQAGTRDRLIRNFGDQGTGAGYRVRLHGLRGVAIRQVIVFWERVEGNSHAWGGGLRDDRQS